MNNLLKILLTLTFVVGQSSCTETTEDVFKVPTPQNERGVNDITVKNTETYTHDLGRLGIEDRATLRTQATHFEQSYITRNSTNNSIYIYQPAAGYTGTDVVQIEICSSIGGPDCYQIDLIELRFNVTN